METANAVRGEKGSSRATMKKQPQPARKEKRSTRNGAEPNSNSRRDRGSSIHGLRHPKTELESAIQRYVDLYDFAPIAYVSFDRAGRIEEANLAATELLSEPRDLLIGRPFAFYAADLDSLLKHLLYCRTSQQQVKTELLLKSRKGEEIPALLLSTPITSTTRNGAVLYQTAIIDLRERKRMEETLELASRLPAENPAPVIRLQDGRVLSFANPAAEQLLQRWGKALGDQAPTTFARVGRAALANGIKRDLEMDFDKRSYVISVCPVLRTNYVNLYFTDITDRKRAEHHLEVNLAVTKILAESPALSDAVPRILQALCETLGWEVGDFWMPEPEAEALRCLKVWETHAGKFPKFKAMSLQRTFAPGIGLPGRVWKNLKPTWIPDVTKDNNFARASIAAGEGLHGAFAFPILFGKHLLAVMEFFGREIREPDEELLRMFASIGGQIGQFIERKRAEERFRQVVELAPTAMIMADDRGRIVLANEAAEEFFGYAQLRELTIEQLFPKRFRGNHSGFLAGFHGYPQQEAKGVGRDLYALTKEGKEVPVEIGLSPIHTEGGDFVLTSIVDLTERKRVETALQKSKELLERIVQQRTKALRTANTELQSEIVRRKGLEGQILEITDREQERLGQELHDGLCQQLTAIGFLARANALRLKDHRVVRVEDLEKIAQLINSSVMDARNIARDLHKEDIDAAQFVPALRNMVERKIWKTPCRLEVKTKINIEDDEVASQLYRILREAIVNANKHARARQIVLEVRRARNELVFS